MVEAFKVTGGKEISGILLSIPTGWIDWKIGLEQAVSRHEYGRTDR